MTASKTPPTLLEQLAAEFPGTAIKSRRQGGVDLTYLSIDAVLNRLNDVAGLNWSSEECELTVTPLSDGKYAAVVSGYIRIGETRRFGVGADVAGDLDKAAKTALAEYVKKAANGFGVGLFLWTEEGRNRAEKLKKLASGSAAALKAEVFAIARERTGLDKPSTAQVAECFDVKPGDLADTATLQQILVNAGLL